MIENIDVPVATARMRWRTAEEGGRRSGPPTAPVYAATCVFPLGGEEAVQPGWPATADKLSILLQEVERRRDGERLYKVGFLFPRLRGSSFIPGRVCSSRRARKSWPQG